MKLYHSLRDTLIPQAKDEFEVRLPQELLLADELLVPSRALPDQVLLPMDDAAFLIRRFKFINSAAFDDAALGAHNRAIYRRSGKSLLMWQRRERQ